jgi:hypothetical protein
LTTVAPESLNPLASSVAIATFVGNVAFTMLAGPGSRFVAPNSWVKSEPG